jgi:hypothetical protein
MQNRNREPRRQKPNSESRNSVLNRRNVSGQDLLFHARYFHSAAKKLAEAPEFDSGSVTEFSACPVVFLYRHAPELHLKVVVLGKGHNFLTTKPDPLTIHRTHSVAWLGQFVSQIIVALKWEKEFRCAEIDGLDDFKTVIEEMNSVDPNAFRLPGEIEAKGACDVRGFATRMDALLVLLDSTADALAAEWDMRPGNG